MKKVIITDNEPVNTFKPYKVGFMIESQAEEDALKELSGANYRLPNYFLTGDFKEVASMTNKEVFKASEHPLATFLNLLHSQVYNRGE